MVCLHIATPWKTSEIKCELSAWSLMRWQKAKKKPLLGKWSESKLNRKMENAVSVVLCVYINLTRAHFRIKCRIKICHGYFWVSKNSSQQKKIHIKYVYAFHLHPSQYDLMTIYLYDWRRYVSMNLHEKVYSYELDKDNLH